MENIHKIPNELARQVASEGKDPARVALEGLALEGYRAERLSESAIRQMLGFESRIQIHAFLKERGVHLHNDLSDLDRDRATSERSPVKRSDSEPTNRAWDDRRSRYVSDQLSDSHPRSVNPSENVWLCGVSSDCARRTVRASAPQLVRSWVDHLPIWLEVRSPLAVPDSSLAKLGAVERDAITLAAELHLIN